MVGKQERSERTRAALIGAARELFAERGFAATATEEVVRRAAVTRGALYHHFRDKAALFEAVYEQIEEELVGRVVAGFEDVQEPVAALKRGADVFLDACLDAGIQRVVLVEGPTVLGWQRFREIDQRYSLGLVTAALQSAMDAGAIRTAPVEPLAHLMLAALVEGGMVLASSAEPRKAREQVGEAIGMLIDGLKA
jgi:AcrR family transcriptional regulator